jgi:Zn-dependent peptidase ImmA (M78 family)/transcriptional regulator with XRE-family HTH domain
MNYEETDLSALAERLVSARKSAGFTQDTAAAHLGISRPTFIAVEKATRRPRPAELLKLAALYRTSVNALLRQETTPPRLQPHLRSVLSNSNTEDQLELESAIAKLTGFIDDYIFLEKKLAAQTLENFPPRIRVQPGPIERFAEHCAQEERARLNLGAHSPIYALRKVLESVGVHVFLDALSSKLAGLYVFVPNFGYCILVNKSHPKERRRWTTAHEYGHFLFDRDKPGVDYLRPFQRKPENEKFADAFAAAFLMPEAGVQRRFYEEMERKSDFNVGDLCRMSSFYAVSLMAMTLRLQSLALVAPGTWDAIKLAGVPIKDLRREAGVQEMPDIDSAEVFPDRYKLLAVQAWVSEKISIGTLAKLLRCTLTEAREFAYQQAEISTDTDGVEERFSVNLNDSLLTTR